MMLQTDPPVAIAEANPTYVVLDRAAPAGDLTVILSSSDATIVSAHPASVSIAEGESIPPANPQGTGELIGSTLIPGRAEGFAPDSRNATVSPYRVSLTPTRYRSSRAGSKPSDTAPVGGLELAVAMARLRVPLENSKSGAYTFSYDK